MLGELNRIYGPDPAVVPKVLFGRRAQFARDILGIESGGLDSRKDPRLDYCEAMTGQGQTADRCDSLGHRIEF
jgi:hypothetical protein